jgi:hypothetical protein
MWGWKMTKIAPNASQIFNFIRGAVRGTWGVEDFRGKRIAVIGMDIVGQQLLTMLCFEGVELFFYADGIVGYDAAHMICGSVTPLAYGDTADVDVVINLIGNHLTIVRNSKMKKFILSDIGNDPYNQGIHEYYQ